MQGEKLRDKIKMDTVERSPETEVPLGWSSLLV